MQEQKIWHAGVLGMTLNVDEGRITIFRSTLETLGWPSHYRFLYNPQMNQIAVQVCSEADAGAHRVGNPMIDLNTLILMMVAVGNILIPFQNKRNAKTVKMSRIIIISRQRQMLRLPKKLRRPKQRLC